MNERIKQVRTSEGLTQAAFSEKIGVSLPTVRSWESGSRTPNQTALYTIADVFKIRLQWLETGEEPMRLPEPDRDQESMLVSELMENVDDPVYGFVKDAMLAYIDLSPSEREVAKKYAASLLERIKQRSSAGSAESQQSLSREKEKPQGG